MKKTSFLWTCLMGFCILFSACDDTETYAEMKEKERDAIRKFIKEQKITPISFDQFVKQDSTTDCTKNEFVLFNDNGVYMQIERKGEGSRMTDGERVEILTRYIEVNIQEGDTLTGNIYDASNPDIMTVTYKGGTYKGAFTSGYMYGSYGSSVPAGWLVPLPYIYLGRNTANVAKVRLIVPHSQGQSTATSYVYPCYYEITYQKGLY